MKRLHGGKVSGSDAESIAIALIPEDGSRLLATDDGMEGFGLRIVEAAIPRDGVHEFIRSGNRLKDGARPAEIHRLRIVLALASSKRLSHMNHLFKKESHPNIEPLT